MDTGLWAAAAVAAITALIALLAMPAQLKEPDRDAPKG
jgi:hypothetical protein